MIPKVTEITAFQHQKENLLNCWGSINSKQIFFSKKSSIVETNCFVILLLFGWGFILETGMSCLKFIKICEKCSVAPQQFNF